MSRSTDYSAKETSGDFEGLSDRLAADLRRSIRQLGSYPMLSDAWMQMAETFGRVASISDVESKLPSKGESKSGGTLWETEEMALRFLLEDGKLNLCLRNLTEYKQYQRTAFQEAKARGEALELDPKCDLFEAGVGVVLRNAWSHLEVLQTTDLPALMNYVADVLEFAINNPDFQEGYASKNMSSRQEVLVFYYMWGMFKNIDDIGESRIMQIARTRGLFMLGARWVDLYHRRLMGPDLLKAVEALALFVETEDFSTYKDKYISSAADSACLQSIKTDCLLAYNSDFDVKRKIRPLLDTIDQAKRRHATK